MKNSLKEYEFEKQRLEETISLSKVKLKEAINGNEENKLAIISAKQELRENTQHSMSSLWGSEAFEALAALSQYVNPVINKIAEFEANENKILLLEKLIKSPYFARIDFKFEGESIFEKIYIGRSSLMNESTYKMYVYDWRAPIASVFYQFVLGKAYYESPNGKITGEVNLKRQFEINNGFLEYFFDADVQIIDEFLRKLLSENTSSKMKSIVETIQREQDIIIRDMENDLMMVQGVAGSGKTSIALHRAAYLMYQGLSSKLSANNILIISPNSLFEKYISNVLPELGENNIVSLVFEEIIENILKHNKIQSRNQFLENILTNPKYNNITRQSLDFKSSKQFLKILDRYIYDLPNRICFENIYFDKNCLISKEDLKDKILSGRKSTPLGIKLKQIEDFILEPLEEANKNFINTRKYFILKKSIQKFTELNVQNLYKELFSNKKYFYTLAKDIELPSNIEDILKFTKENLYNDLLHYDDAVVLTFLNLKINGTNEYKHIKQVVIDEAQDYYTIHYEIFNLLFSNSKYTVLGDINQTLEKQESLSLYEQIKDILNKKKSTLVIMDKSFRCTNEILIYSSKFLDKNTEIKSFNRNGDMPNIFSCVNKNSFIEMIVNEINYCIKKGYKSIGLICKTKKNSTYLFETLKNKINIQLIKNDCTEDLQGVFIIPVYMSKGLEFDAVLVCDADNKNYYNKDDKKILYIACTRALHRLNLFCIGNISPLIKKSFG